MKAFLSLLVLLVALLMAASAQPLPGSIFGHTEAEARSKYGTPVKVTPATPATAPAEGNALCFEKNGVYVTVAFLRGVVAQVGYVRKDRIPFTPQESLTLLQNHAPVTKWNMRRDVQTPGEVWMESVDLVAIIYENPGMIMVCTRAYADGMLAARAARLKGL